MYRLIYTLIGGNLADSGQGLRLTNTNLDTLITVAEAEQHLYDSAHISDRRGHLIYEPSLGREIVQLEAPPADEPGWWKDEAGYWHQKPC